MSPREGVEWLENFLRGESIVVGIVRSGRCMVFSASSYADSRGEAGALLAYAQAGVLAGGNSGSGTSRQLA